MLFKKTLKKSLYEIGKKKFDFDIHKERAVYAYLCYQRVEKRERDKLTDENLLFDYYCDWKRYIEKKYEEYDAEDLIEFSRYLAQRERNTKPMGAYWVIIITVMLTELISMMIDALLGITSIDTSDAPWYYAIIVFILIIAILGMILYFVSEFWSILYKNSMEEHLFIDYKEVIEEMRVRKSK